ncbi:hypothetical protein FRC07_002683 [Ceratobasidium sp. 392]|nr:hypothetical protein FRC07_002683 [Ceratobasidium sp. 392]
MSRPVPRSVRAPSNALVAAFRNHPLEGRHLINFSKGSGFLKWCADWGDIIQFNRLEYCKFEGRIGHEFILLHELQRNPQVAPIQQDPSVATRSEASRKLELWSSLDTGLDQKICQLERMGDPEAPLDAFISSTDAFDYANIYERDSNTDKEQREKTYTLLDISFPEAHTLTEVLEICYRISCHDKSCSYKLLQYNCYFFCWNIILGLTRSGAHWEKTLERESNLVSQTVFNRLQDFACSEAQKYNLAFVLAGHHSRSNTTSRSPLLERMDQHIRSDVFHEALRARLASTLWVRDQKEAIGCTIKELLNQAGDATVDLVLAGTPEKTLDSLLRRDIPLNLNLSSEWKSTIQTEFNRLFQLYLGADMWSSFGTSLDQTSLADRQYIEKNQLSQDLSLLQKARYSQPVVTARLWPLGWKTIINNARVAASVDVPDPKNNPVDYTLKVLQKTPEQYANLSRVAGSFVSVARAGMKKQAAEGKPFKIKGVGDNVLQLVGNINLDPEEMEDRVVTELVYSIGNMARYMLEKHPEQHNASSLRMASLQLLSNLKTKGRKLKYFIDPLLLWRLGLWYSLGGNLTGSIVELSEALWRQSEPPHKCKQGQPSSDGKYRDENMIQCELNNAEIQQWIADRIKDLSRILLKGATSQLEIENTISEIWADQRSWWNLRVSVNKAWYLVF